MPVDPQLHASSDLEVAKDESLLETVERWRFAYATWRRTTSIDVGAATIVLFSGGVAVVVALALLIDPLLR